jgi:uncharacterized RDD family membrane protein YckC
MDQTTTPTGQAAVKPPAEDETSTMFGVSIRAWLALLIVGTICAISVLHAYATVRLVLEGTLRPEDLKIGEPLYSLGGMALGFYFGQKMVKGGGASG